MVPRQSSVTPASNSFLQKKCWPLVGLPSPDCLTLRQTGHNHRRHALVACQVECDGVTAARRGVGSVYVLAVKNALKAQLVWMFICVGKGEFCRRALADELTPEENGAGSRCKNNFFLPKCDNCLGRRIARACDGAQLTGVVR